MWDDFRFALRTLGRSPGFAAVAVLSLGLGIGANTAIFSLLYQVVLRSVPVKDPGSLVALESDRYAIGWTRQDNNYTILSYPMYQALRDQNQVFTGLIARSSFPATLVYRGDAVRATAEVVTGNFFEVLGLQPALGRLLIPSDDGVPGRNPVMVLSYSYWVGHLGADPSVLNSQILVNGHAVLVVGVAPRGFRSLLPGRDPEFFAPVSMMGMISPGWHQSELPDAYWLSLFGRLKPGMSEQRANAMLLPLFRSVLQDELPRMKDVREDARKKILQKPMRVQSAARGLNILRDDWQTPLVVLLVMAGLVLLIACANVASLLIARAAARQREIALRLAVGATGWQLARQFMVESVVLSMAGGFVGLLLSQNLAAGLLSLLPADTTGGWLAPQFDFALLAGTFGLSLVAGLLFAAAPVLAAIRTDVAPALRASQGGSNGGSPSRTRQCLVVAQISISLLLLIGAGLFTRSLVNLVSSDLGFRKDHLVTFSIDPGLSGYASEQRISLFRDLQERLSGIPGVKSVAQGQLIPLGGWGWGTRVKVPGSHSASDDRVGCGENSVGPGYFATLGIPLLVGRDFGALDTAHSPRVAILSETLARTLFADANPIGRHVVIGADDADTEVTGVVKDSQYYDVGEKPPQFVYVPFEQAGDEYTQQSAFFLRVQGSENRVLTAVRGVVKQLDRNLPIDRLTTMETLVQETIYTQRLIATLAIAFGILASILAAVGVYGIISYAVARRTREFGIRLVLGAIPKSLLWSVIREVGLLTAIGVGVGLPASYALARLAESQLYGIHAHDVWVLTGATVIIVAVALLAGLAPAMRAMRIEPIRALRHE
jgi:predicted permease